MSPNPVSVEIYTVSHRVLGRITPGSAGLYAFINVSTRSSVELEGAHLSRLNQPARLIARYPKLWLSKENIVCVLMSSRSEMGSVSVTRHGYSSVLSHWVHVMLPGYELRGVLETAGKLEIGAVMVESERTFTPLYNARMEAILFPDIDATTPAMLFNNGRITAMSPLRKEDIPDQEQGG